ncbi:hypothetical protein QCA50_005656 [Cerrena zonata]|uniref:Major facilitator superfamily (MFS) profile domain-containing protein n=1 Tax=Cerrena zonata TaxID=2478898 RepID=A0AAW0GJY4_9APHY
MSLSDMPAPLRSAEPTPSDLLDAGRSTEDIIDPLPHIATTLAFPDGPGVAAETAEIINESFHPHENHTPPSRRELPWWKRPSPWWFMVLIPLLTITSSAEQAPKIAIYTKLVCETHTPRGTVEQGDLAIRTFKNLVSTLRNDDPCASDPVVQATVAKLQLSILLTGGILGVVTAAWLSSFSDRRGRVFVIGIMSLSFFFEDFWLIFVTKSFQRLPGGYWFLVVGSVITGLLGGGSGGISGALHAYLADCTEPHERSRVFSIAVGVNWVGGALGPTIGGLLTRHTGSLLSSFYMSFLVRVFVSAMVWFAVPESLSKSAMQEAERLHHERTVDGETGSASWLSGIYGLFAPLSVFLPSWTAKDRWSLRNWSLTFAILSLAASQPVYGLMEFEVQYMMVVFRWTTEQVGYYLSIIGTVKAVFLSLIFPAITLALNRPKPAISLPTEESEPLQSDSSRNTSLESSSLPHSVSADLAISRVSLLISIIPFALIPFAPSALMYTALNGVVCFGTAFSPAIQSVALGIYTANGGLEAGKLFGAIGIVQTVGVSLLAPSLYGVTFMKTVGTFPAAIYLLSAGFVVISLVFALLTRPVHPTKVIEETQPDN